MDEMKIKRVKGFLLEQDLDSDETGEIVTYLLFGVVSRAFKEAREKNG